MAELTDRRNTTVVWMADAKNDEFWEKNDKSPWAKKMRELHAMHKKMDYQMHDSPEAKKLQQQTKQVLDRVLGQPSTSNSATIKKK